MALYTQTLLTQYRYRQISGDLKRYPRQKFIHIDFQPMALIRISGVVKGQRVDETTVR